MGLKKIMGSVAVTALLAAAVSGCALPANAMAGAVEDIRFGPEGITVVVDGQEINITADTEIGGLLAEGTVIKVTLEVQDDGSLLATKVHVKGNGSEDDQDEGKIKLEGIIESLSDDSLVVDGQTIAINEDTEIEGTLAEGVKVEVKVAVQDDDSLLALKIEVEDEDDIHENSHDVEEDENDGQHMELEGTIESLSDDSLVVDGQTIAINEDTRIEGTLAEGTFVEVKVALQDDDSLLALKIEVEDEDDTHENSHDEENDSDHDGHDDDGDVESEDDD